MKMKENNNSEDNNEDNDSGLVLRPYQQKVLSAALKSNTIAFLPTGAGKTLIAVHLIKKRVESIRKRIILGQNKQLIVFLAPTKILVGQQRKYIESNCDAVVSEFTSDTTTLEGRSSANWSKSVWQDVFIASEVLVMTPEILKQMLHRKFFLVKDFDSVIIDECHHAYGNNPIVTVCQILSESVVKPLILGMTASPIACKSGSIFNKITELERNINCKLLCSLEILADFKKLVPIPNYSLFRFSSEHSDMVERSSLTSEYFNTAKTIRAKTNSVFPVEPVEIASHASYLMLHALLRVRHGNYINEVYKLLRTVQMQPADFAEMAVLNLPSHDALYNLRKMSPYDERNNPVIERFFQMQTPHLLPAPFSVYSGLSDLSLSIGKLICIAEECGTLCTLHAYYICLTGKSMATTAQAAENVTQSVHMAGSDSVQFNITTAEAETNSTLVEVTTVVTTKETPLSVKRGKFLHGTSDCVSSVDLDKVSGLIEELINSPFQSIDLINQEYIACVSMLDVLAALVSSFDSAIILSARSIVVAQFGKEKEVAMMISSHSSVASNLPELETESSDEDESIPNNLENSGNSIPVCHQLICCLLQRIAESKAQCQGPIMLQFQVEGVLTLLPEFCIKYSRRKENFQLTDDNVRLAVSDACKAIVQSVSFQILQGLFEANTPSMDYRFEPLSKDAHKYNDVDLLSGKNMVEDGATTEGPQKDSTAILALHLAIQYRLVTSKVKALYHVWATINSVHLRIGEAERQQLLQQFDEAPQQQVQDKDWSGIVFCRMRLTALSLSNLMTTLCCEHNIIAGTISPSVVDDTTTTLLHIDKDQRSSLLPTHFLLDYSSDDVIESGYTMTASAKERVNLDFTAQTLSSYFSFHDIKKKDAAELCQRTRLSAFMSAHGSNRMLKACALQYEKDFRALHIVGSSKQKRQLDALMRFKNGEFNILFATDVVEEGLDVKVCQYVINFDLPKTVKSYIQRRGRARATNSTIIAMVPNSDTGTTLIHDLISFDRQEVAMEMFAERNASELFGADVSWDRDDSLVPLVEVLAVVTHERPNAPPVPPISMITPQADFNMEMSVKVFPQLTTENNETDNSTKLVSLKAAQCLEENAAASKLLRNRMFSCSTGIAYNNGNNNELLAPRSGTKCAAAIIPINRNNVATRPLPHALNIQQSNNFDDETLINAAIHANITSTRLRKKKNKKRKAISFVGGPAVTSGDLETDVRLLMAPYNKTFFGQLLSSEPLLCEAQQKDEPDAHHPIKKIKMVHFSLTPLSGKTKSLDLANNRTRTAKSKHVVPLLKRQRASKLIEKYEVASTGVAADIRSSTQLLARFCQLLPHDSFYSPQPVYWITTIRADPLTSSRQASYKCSILLPPAVPMRCRFVVGPECDNKVQAKGMASLESIKQLHLCGEINDLLMTNGSKQADKAIKDADAQQQQQKALLEEKEADNKNTNTSSIYAKAPVTKIPDTEDDEEMTVVNRKRSLDAMLFAGGNMMGGEEEEVHVAVKTSCKPAVGKSDSDVLSTVVKTVPDSLTVPPATSTDTSGNSMVSLYLYSVRANFDDSLAKEIILNCTSCANNFFAINDVGIAFTSELPQDVFKSVFECNFRETEGLNIKIELLEHRKVSQRALFEMQRFHRSVLCWESETKHYRNPDLPPVISTEIDKAGLPDEEWLPHDANLDEYYDGSILGLEELRDGSRNNKKSKVPMSHDEWRKSSNGAWYVIFPLPDDIYVKTEGVVVSLHDVAVNRDPRATFNCTSEWEAFLKQSADEAQVLAHNLRMQEVLNKMEYSEFYQPFLPVKPANDLAGLLVSRGPGGIFWIPEDNDADTDKKHLGCIVKYVKPELLLPPTEKEANTIIDNNNRAEAETIRNESGECCCDDETIACTIPQQESVNESADNNNQLTAASILASSSVPSELVATTEQKMDCENSSGEALIAISYADHFLVKYPKYEKFIREMESDSSKKLYKVVPITSRLTLTYLLGKAYNKWDDQMAKAAALPCYSSLLVPIQPKKVLPPRVRKNHSHSNPIYLIPDFCRPIGRVKWLTVGFVAPSIIWRIQSLLHSVEARKVVVAAVVDFEKNYVVGEKIVQAVAVAGENDSLEIIPEVKALVKEDMTLDNSSVLTVPRAAIMLETLTPRLAKENLDSERLELLGDSLLKLVSSVEIYRIYPSKHEGFLTSARSKVISNLHLTAMSQKLGIDHYLRAFPLSSGKQQLLVRPPGMTFEGVSKRLSLWNENLVAKRTAAVDGEPATTEDDKEDSEFPQQDFPGEQHQVTRRTEREIADENMDSDSFFTALYPRAQFEAVEVKSKALADVMEAIFGGFYVEGGLKAGVTAIKALGCWPVFDAHSSELVVTTTSSKKSQHTTASRNNHHQQHSHHYSWVAAVMAISHREQEIIEFPIDFPEPLKRIAMGYTIGTSAVAEQQDDDDSFSNILPPPVVVEKTVQCTTIKTSVQEFTPTIIRNNTLCKSIADAVANALGYRFQNWNILDEALTHCSVQYKRSNQRMEFLGDAILDFGVVSLLFRHQSWAKQGDLSSQKSVATSNKNLGQFGARLQLYKYLSISSQQLEMEFSKLHVYICSAEFRREDREAEEEELLKKQRTIQNKSTNAFARKNIDLLEEEGRFGGEGRVHISNNPRIITISNGASKALADTLEALMGAVYLDSLGSMDAVYDVLRHINLLPQLLDQDEEEDSAATEN